MNFSSSTALQDNQHKNKFLKTFENFDRGSAAILSVPKTMMASGVVSDINFTSYLVVLTIFLSIFVSHCHGTKSKDFTSLKQTLNNL